MKPRDWESLTLAAVARWRALSEEARTMLALLVPADGCNIAYSVSGLNEEGSAALAELQLLGLAVAIRGPKKEFLYRATPDGMDVASLGPGVAYPGGVRHFHGRTRHS